MYPHAWRAVLVTSLVAATALSVPAQAGPPAKRPAGNARTVTLITGDVVRISELAGGKSTIDVTRGSGATGGVRIDTVNGSTYVIPDEVQPFLAAKTLDRRLFNVTGLLELGYDDQSTASLPLIFTYGGAAPRSQPPGAEAVRSLPSIGGAAVNAAKSQTLQLWDTVTRTRGAGFGGGISKIWLDGKVKVNLAESTKQIGADAAWNAGLDGKGVKVAMLDTGYDTDHADLSNRVSSSKSFVPDETVEDANGHGTHVLSTIGGSGAESGGLEKGVAHGSDLLVGKVLSDEGFGQDSWIIDGMQWAVDSGAKVVSMSLGSREASDGTDPMAAAVNQLSKTGTLFVIAAGNSYGEVTIGSPGAADAALTVAAVDSGDAKADFSSQGPRLGDYALKPDISAPGVDILAAKNGGGYQELSGTSMATPHVAGAAAILLQQHPEWNGEQVKAALMSTSKQLPDTTVYQLGTGRADLTEATTNTVTATGSAYFGFFGWPREDDQTTDKTVTYSNSGDQPVTLHLEQKVAVAGGPYDAPSGGPGPRNAIPDGMFKLSADTVTVPAHGTANVTATAEPKLGGAGVRYLGDIVAKDDAGKVRAHTTVGLYAEDERYSLNVSVLDRAGKPAGGYLYLQTFGVGGGWSGDEAVVTSYPVDATTGTAEIRLRSGTYSANMWLDVQGEQADRAGLALLGDPQIVMDKNQELVLDARKADQVKTEVPRPVEDRFTEMEWYRSDGKFALDALYWVPIRYEDLYVSPTEKTTIGEFEYSTRWRQATPTLTIDGTITEPQNRAVLDGKMTLPTVYAGTGTPADYTGLDAQGKAVVVTRSDAITPEDRAKAAADAGAKLLVVVNDKDEFLFEYIENEAISVVSLSSSDGAKLVETAKAGKTVPVEAAKNAPYLYDLVDRHPGQVPAELTYRPKDLARVQMNFHGAQKYSSGDFRYDFRTYRQRATGALQHVDAPGTRVDYVTPDSPWYAVAKTGPDYAWEVREDGLNSFKKNQRLTSDWFGPVVRPRLNDGFWGPKRHADWMEINLQGYADGGAGHAGSYTGPNGDLATHAKLTRDGVVIDESDWGTVYDFEAPADASYVFEETTQRDPALWNTSLATKSVWSWRQKAPSGDASVGVPLIQLDYKVDTDLAGKARRGLQHVGVGSSYVADVVDGGKIGAPSVEVSYDDGKTWKKVPVVSLLGKHTAVFLAPHGASSVSLRTAVKDSKGNSVTQEVIRAYVL